MITVFLLSLRTLVTSVCGGNHQFCAVTNPCSFSQAASLLHPDDRIIVVGPMVKQPNDLTHFRDLLTNALLKGCTVIGRNLTVDGGLLYRRRNAPFVHVEMAQMSKISGFIFTNFRTTILSIAVPALISIKECYFTGNFVAASRGLLVFGDPVNSSSHCQINATAFVENRLVASPLMSTVQLSLCLKDCLVARNTMVSQDDATLFSFQIQGHSLLERVMVNHNFFPNASLVSVTDSTGLCCVGCRFSGNYGKTMFFIDDGSLGSFNTSTIEGNHCSILKGYSADDILFNDNTISGNSAGDAAMLTIWRSPLGMLGGNVIVNNSGTVFAEFKERRGQVLLGAFQYNWNKFTECHFSFQFQSTSQFVGVSAKDNSGPFICGNTLSLVMAKSRFERLNGKVVKCHDCAAVIHESIFIDSVFEMHRGIAGPTSVKSCQFIGSEPPFDPPLEAFMTAVRVSGRTPHRCLFCDGGVWDEGFRDFFPFLWSEWLGLAVVGFILLLTWRSTAAFVRFLIFG
jgi:hypothetical protein